MKELIKSYGIDLFSMFSLYLSIYLYSHGHPRVSMMLLSVVMVIIIVPAIFLAKYMLIKRELIVFPILISAVTHRSEKLFFFASNLVMYSIYFYLISKLESLVGVLSYGESFDSMMGNYIFAYFLSLVVILFFDLLILICCYNSEYVDKKLASCSDEIDTMFNKK